MTKKQFGIIFTLLALIVCVGVLAAKINEGGLNDPAGLTVVSPDEDKDNDQETNTQNDVFFDLKTQKEQVDSKYLGDLKAVVEDKNTAAEQKAEANKKIVDKTTYSNYEKRIELNIKKEGFEDVLCFIDDSSKARVIVKSQDGLDEKNSVTIREIVQDVAKISNVQIEVKK